MDKPIIHSAFNIYIIHLTDNFLIWSPALVTRGVKNRFYN
jgi:hypothetical protein